MKPAELGSKIEIHYIGTLDDGRIFDTRDGESPLTITLGNDEIFSALEKEIIGMKVGQVKNILIHAEEAFGFRSDKNIINLDRTVFPPEQQIKVGQKVSLDFRDGSSRIVRIIEVNDNHVTADGNHALAGHDLTFALKLAAIF